MALNSASPGLLIPVGLVTMAPNATTGAGAGVALNTESEDPDATAGAGVDVVAEVFLTVLQAVTISAIIAIEDILINFNFPFLNYRICCRNMGELDLIKSLIIK